MCEYIQPRKRNKRLTSPTNVKQFALEYAALHGRARFTRCSRKFLQAIERNTLELVQRMVNARQMKGVTL